VTKQTTRAAPRRTAPKSPTIDAHGHPVFTHGLGGSDYIYRTASGERYMMVQHRGSGGGDRQFYQKHWDAAVGQWESGLNGIEPILYNLPRVVKGVQDGEDIYWAEGERDVDHLDVHGVVATTNPMGEGGGWRDSYTESLVAAGVKTLHVIWDRDDPGRRLAWKVADSVQAADINVKWRRAAVGKDAADHINAKLGVGDLVRERPKRPPARLTRPEPHSARLRASEDFGTTIPRGERDSTLTRLAGKLRRGGLGAEDMALMLEVYNQKRCEPPLSNEQVQKIARSVGRYASGDGRPSKTGNLMHYGPGDLAKPPVPLSWLIRGVWPLESHGGFGGKQKTLKTICAMAGGIAVASGKPMLNYERWAVPQAGPVLYMVGEGGYNFAHRRVQRIANDIYGIAPLDLDDVPLHLMVGIAEMNSDYYREKTMEFVREFGPPRLVVLDNLYNFHDAGIEVGNLYARGAMLSEYQHFIQAECGPCGLQVLDHFRKSADSNELDEFMQSGMAQWSDAWWLARARKPYDPDEGRSWLTVNIGTRQATSGGVYHIDIDEGPFDEQSDVYVRPMRVEVRRASAQVKDVRRNVLAVVNAVGENPGIVKRNLENHVGVTKQKVADAESAGLIVISDGPRGAQLHHLTQVGEAMYLQPDSGPIVREVP
jgi:hypothetical protein